MNSENDRHIDDMIGNVLKDDVSTDVEQRLRSQLEAFRSRLGEMEKPRPLAGQAAANVADGAQAESRRRALAHRSVFPWRWILCSPVSRVAAAVFVLAVAGIALWFHAGGPTYAFADFVKPILEAKSAKFKVTFERNGKQVATANGMWLAPNRTRMELQQPGQPMEIRIADASKGVGVRIDAAKKTVVINKVVGLPRELASLDPLEEMRSLLRDAGKRDVKRQSLGEKEIDGRRAIGWRVSGPGLHAPGVTATIWGDSQTGLPISIESYSALEGVKCTLSDFAFNVDLDKSLFSIEPPTGYTVQTVQVDASEPAEKDLIAVLREYGKWMNNAFPESLDWHYLNLTLQACISIELRGGGEAPSEELVRKIAAARTDEEIGQLVRAEIENTEKKKQAELQQLMKENASWDQIQAKIAKRGRQSFIDAFNAKVTRVSMMIDRGMGFVAELPREADAHYAGKGVSLGAPGTPIFWYRPKDAKKYRVIYADLSVREADTPPDVSKAQPLPGASSPKE